MKFEVDENEYGIVTTNAGGANHTQGKRIIDVQFQPSQFGILDKYQPIKEIYKVQLSPTIITLASNMETNQVGFLSYFYVILKSFLYKQTVIKKSIQKNKLMSPVQHNYARQECTIHSQLRHDNVVELYDYSENQDEIVLIMEYCNDAGYFEDKIESVSKVFLPHQLIIH